MIRQREQATVEASPVLWGLSTRELHDAFWHARGVQCVRRGETVVLQGAAELYLLVERDQLVMFNLSELSDRLTWRNALLTRLRIVDEHADPYSERVVLDDDGYVEQIERRYTPTMYGSYRVILTPSRRLAAAWMQSAGRREAWDRLRRSVPWSRVDHCRCDGAAFRLGDPRHERRFLDELVAVWPQPDQAIDGIVQIDEGVWCLDGEDREDATVRIGPIWLGRGAARDRRPCLVGPRWVDDHVAAVDGPAGVVLGATTASVRAIADVEPANSAHLPLSSSSHTVYGRVKRVIDIVVSAAALVMLSPIMATIAAVILLEDGRPLFFGQRREGRAGRTFSCWKFRSMVPNAEEIARELEEYNLADGAHVFIQDDPRVTRVGKVIRATHLDELPQLWSVLVGQMSLVGPRPSPREENQFCPAWRDERLSVRPGITGLWQLHRTRAEGEDFQEWIKYDIEYVREMSFWMDVRIIWGTALIVLTGRK